MIERSAEEMMACVDDAMDDVLTAYRSQRASFPTSVKTSCLKAYVDTIDGLATEASKAFYGYDFKNLKVIHDHVMWRVYGLED